MKRFLLFILITITFTRASFTKQILHRECSNNEYAALSEEIMPVFPGGEEALIKYLKENVVYPKLAYNNKIEGRVEVDFIIERDGSISNVKIRRPLGYGCDEEAMRVIRNMPRWKPGMQDGKPVRVSYMIPLKFTLTKSKTKKNKKSL